MNKIFYRNFGTYEAIVCCHATDIDGTSHAGVRWYELRKTPPSTSWVIYQQGTYAGEVTPPDALHRWMACIAINAESAIGLGYNKSGTTSFPSMWFTARKACDPLGFMAEPEQSVINGTAPNASIRYGDYNGMQVDPVDGSFWFTANYNPATQWATRVAKFTVSGTCGGCTPFITGQPANATTCAGSMVSYTVTASGSPLTYQWQLSTNGGVSFSDIGGATAATLSFTATAGQNGYQYRCVVTGTCAPTTATSNAAILTITTPPGISAHPVGVSVCAGANTGFSVTGTGGSLSYQWQVSTNGGAAYSNLSNTGVYSGTSTSAMIITNVTSGMNTYLYRCIIYGACSPEVTSNAALLTVNTPVSITMQPVSKSVCTNSSWSFTVTAAGSSPFYQWQLSTTGAAGPWNNISNAGVYSGASTGSLTITGISANMNAYQYRCLITNSAGCNAVISSNVVLTVLSLPVVSISAAPYTRLFPGLTTALTAMAIPSAVSYAWYRNNVLLPGNTGNSLSINIDGFGNYNVIVTDANGCSNSSAFINISDSVTDQLFIYPNPNAGLFQVRYHNNSVSGQPRNIVILDAKGARVAVSNYTVNGPYDKMEIELRNTGSGVYWIELQDTNGKRLAVGRIVKY